MKTETLEALQAASKAAHTELQKITIQAAQAATVQNLFSIIEFIHSQVTKQLEKEKHEQEGEETKQENEEVEEVLAN